MTTSPMIVAKPIITLTKPEAIIIIFNPNLKKIIPKINTKNTIPKIATPYNLNFQLFRFFLIYLKILL